MIGMSVPALWLFDYRYLSVPTLPLLLFDDSFECAYLLDYKYLSLPTLSLLLFDGMRVSQELIAGRSRQLNWIHGTARLEGPQLCILGKSLLFD